jgi:Kdo2-lipid IVA 3' secondary acyltransferase
MSEAPATKPATAPISLLQRFLAWLVAVLLEGLGWTLRFKVEDRAGITTAPANEPYIWSFWHNRLLVLPILRHRYFSHRADGATMASQSKDGEWAAHLIRRVRITPIRGSTARGGSSALREAARFLRRGEDIGFTPDGSRGPRYHLKAGVILLAQISGRPIIPVGVEYARCFRFKSWDGFMIPVPFSRVEVTYGELVHVIRTHGDTEFEAERLRCEQAMMALVKTY